MALSGNKGEWSEIYTLLKLLGDGHVYGGDENLNQIQELLYPIVMILREENQGNFNYKTDKTDIVIQTPEGKELSRIPAEIFINEAENLLTSIHSKSGIFELPDTESFLNKIHCHTLKAKSSDKTDIHIVFHDQRTQIETEMGFSIKSQLGSNSTLLNAGKTTNFKYKIVGGEFDDQIMNAINAIHSKAKIVERYLAIKAQGGSLEFDSVDNRHFKNNLLLLDGDLPLLISHLLIEQIETGISSIPVLANSLTVKNPMGYDYIEDDKEITPYYPYKIKHLLTSTALGMMPGKSWNGKFDANGGYLIVRNDGSILCYHFYDRNRFEDFLYNNAYLERASSTRHEYGSIIKEDGAYYFKLNLQIRLK